MAANKPELKLEVLSRVKQYYPIGLPYSNQHYAGYKELLGIVERKINDLLKNGRLEIWSSLVEQLGNRFPKDSIQDMAYQQNPNLLLRVILKSTSDNILERTRTVTICISLLSFYYTIFFVEELRPIGSVRAGFEPPVRTVWYSNASCEQEAKYFDLVDNLIRQYYPMHKFIDHYFLFKMEISGGIPHGEDIEIGTVQNPSHKYSAFDFLFGLDDRIANRQLIIYN